MIRADLHKFNCSFYQHRNDIVRRLYRALVGAQDQCTRLQIAQAIERECILLQSRQGRERHPCTLCRKIAVLRLNGLNAFLRNFKFADDAAFFASSDIGQSIQESYQLRKSLKYR